MVAVKVSAADVSFVAAGGPDVIVVSGGVAVIVQSRVSESVTGTRPALVAVTVNE
jgi:hypothetical protein